MGDHNQFTVRPDELEGLANTLDASMDGLRDLTPSAGSQVDAGISTGVVSETLGKIYMSVASAVTDAEHQIGEVRASGGEYLRSDEQEAQSEFPPIAIPPNLDNGGN